MLAFFAACVAGLMLHWAGTLVGAFGEALFALRDIAVNAGSTAESLRQG